MSFCSTLKTSISIFVLMIVMLMPDWSKKSVERGPSSHSSLKAASLKHHLHDSISHTTKLQGPLDVRIERTTPALEKPGDHLGLRAVITSRANLDHVDMKWHLPSEVEVVRGQLTQQKSMTTDEVYEMEITVLILDEGNRQIHFQAQAPPESEVSFATSAQYNTWHEDQLRLEKERLATRSKKLHK